MEPLNDLKAHVQEDWLSLSLIEAGREKLLFMEPNEDPQELEIPYKDYEDYCNRGKVIVQPEVSVFKLKDHPATELLYPLVEPSGPHLLLPDAVALLRNCLDLRLIHRLMICDFLNEDEVWFKQTTSHRYEINQIAIEAKAFSNGRISLYRPQNLEQAAEPFDREWLTELKGDCQASGIFDQVKELEDLNPDKPNLQMSEVAWCWFGLMILSPQAAVPLVVAEQNPIRCALIAAAIKERLQSLPQQLQSPRHEQILARCRYMAGSVSTDAERDLNNRMINPSQDQIARISQILEFLQRHKD